AEAFELALVENIQRSDLNPIEEALAYRRLCEEHGYTQEQVADRVGKDRTTIANALRLLKLPALVRSYVSQGELTMGHARALLAWEEMSAIESPARKVRDRALSVRATEELVRRVRNPQPVIPPEQRAATEKSPAVRDLEQRLTRTIGARVVISDKGGNLGG